MAAGTQKRLARLLSEVRACRICEAALPLGPRPVLRARATAKVLVVGQAPGTRVHETGIPWNDPSGDRLRKWMQLDRETFYDESRIAIVPMGFCYPGKDPRGGDLPPRKECSQHWHARVLELLPDIRLTLLFGRYAQRYFLGENVKKDLTATVRAWRDYGPVYLPMPHPSPRNIGWFKRNPWFENEVVPELRRRLVGLL